MAVDRKAEILNTADGHPVPLVRPEGEKGTFRGLDLDAWYEQHPAIPEQERCPITPLSEEQIFSRLRVKDDVYSLVEDVIDVIEEAVHLVGHLPHPHLHGDKPLESTEPLREGERPSVLRVVHDFPALVATPFRGHHSSAT